MFACEACCPLLAVQFSSIVCKNHFIIGQSATHCIEIFCQGFKTSRRWIAANAASYHDTLNVKETQLTSTKNGLHVASESSSGAVATVSRRVVLMFVVPDLYYD